MEGQQPSADYVELVSKDGFSFFVTRKAACVSNTIKQMLSSEGFTESEHNKINFPEISGAILERVCQYFAYKLRWQNTPTKQIPEFPLPPDQALVLLKAANYLDT